MEEQDTMTLEDAVEGLLSASRRNRQQSARLINLMAEKDPSALKPFIPALLDGLLRPEAQTRWEIFRALSLYAGIDASVLTDAVESAEMSLFDEDSAPLRLASFVFLCNLGAASDEYSQMVWPLLDEALQCYHGDVEYPDMLEALLVFAQGNPCVRIKTRLNDRLSYDAEHGVGSVLVLSEKICALVREEEPSEA